MQEAVLPAQLLADVRFQPCLAAGGALYAVRDRPGLTLGLCESAVTAPVRGLTAAGLPAKAPHPREHRAVVLEPTEAGNTALDATRPVADRFDAEPGVLLGPGGFARTAGALRRPAFR
ncbi:MarR family winged helix-turn-helix transcriptional regulator [Streptomyces shenzhenensis]|uniref:MarR family winged helix-turn-helix transcriptional regulator n=1 Tax=Streptomyces shenzhenensis TaxID=943815 RepID=UPI003D8E954D